MNARTREAQHYLEGRPPRSVYRSSHHLHRTPKLFLCACTIAYARPGAFACAGIEAACVEQWTRSSPPALLSPRDAMTGGNEARRQEGEAAMVMTTDSYLISAPSPSWCTFSSPFSTRSLLSIRNCTRLLASHSTSNLSHHQHACKRTRNPPCRFGPADFRRPCLKGCPRGKGRGRPDLYHGEYAYRA